LSQAQNCLQADSDVMLSKYLHHWPFRARGDNPEEIVEVSAYTTLM
jgi:hypothetical protein